MQSYITNAQDNLFKAKTDYENTVKLLGDARDVLCSDKLAYEIAYAKCYVAQPVAKTTTLAKEIVLIEVSEVYAQYMRSEVAVKKFEAMVRMFEELIQTEKIFLKIRYGNLN